MATQTMPGQDSSLVTTTQNRFPFREKRSIVTRKCDSLSVPGPRQLFLSSFLVYSLFFMQPTSVCSNGALNKANIVVYPILLARWAISPMCSLALSSLRY